MPQQRSRPGDGARGAAMVGGLAGQDLDTTANGTATEDAPRALIVEGCGVRAATAAELRRAAARGMIGGRA